MERTVPRTDSQEIELYLRTIYSLLRSTTAVQIRSLEEAHASMNSSLHPNARSGAPDVSAFIYSLLRLPDCMPNVQQVLLGQSAQVFSQHGYPRVESWRTTPARARRRRTFFDGRRTLACFIVSRSDIEDILPTMTAYQIEWNKLHFLLNRLAAGFDLELAAQHQPERLAGALQMTVEELERLRAVWGGRFLDNLKIIARQRCDLQVRLLNGSLSEYWRATRAWWENIERTCPGLLQRPVYFISSNPHSITNLLSGYALSERKALMAFLKRPENAATRREWVELQSRRRLGDENLLYYLLKKLQQGADGAESTAAQLRAEQGCGITRIASDHYFEVDAQVVELSELCPPNFDPRLGGEDFAFLKRSDALILNVDYPLGLGAYNILAKVAEHVSPVLGVYSMGKGATLNGVIGDVMIPNVVHDEQSQNTYMFTNAFNAADVAPFLDFGSVLDNQKAVSVQGTFLQNSDFMDVFYREGYTDIEMEAGPYLSAVYEMYRPTRHPVNEIVNLQPAPFDVGILHYASDKPISKGRNLGAGTLSFAGMDSTYATSIAILRRILQRERARVGQG
ncbi:MAG: hypothetical protein HPY76_00225 [Anaerolineae bacterium]|nr:hypothetical protein [Anaerolineae bacterium]